MGLTDISDRKTPSDPSELAFDAETGLPNNLQTLLLIGRAASSLAASATYIVKVINNVTDDVAAQAEMAGYGYGANSEITKMVQAAIQAAADAGNFPAIKVMPLASTDVDFGTVNSVANIALVNSRNVTADFIVSPFDPIAASGTRVALEAHAVLVSGQERPDNNQFGSFGVILNNSVTDPSTLPLIDSQALLPIWNRDTSGVQKLSIGEQASACAARCAANIVPFNPLDAVRIANIPSSPKASDPISVGAGAESETSLNQGWTPLRVKANGDVAFVRTVTGRVTNGISTAPVSAYYDLQDFQVLYYWRKTIWTREQQVDFKNVKASADKAKNLKAEMIRLANVFQDNQMFQSVAQLASQFAVQRSQTDRSRFDVLTPVNVIPGLHVIATKVLATTQFDTFTV